MQKFLIEQAACLDRRDEFRSWLRKKSIDPDDLTLEKFKKLSKAFDIEDREATKTEFNEWLKATTGFEVHQIRDQKHLDKQYHRFKQEVFAKYREEKEFEHYLSKRLNMQIPIENIDEKHLRSYKKEFYASIEASKRKKLVPTEGFVFWLESKGIENDLSKLSDELTQLLLENYQSELQNQQGMDHFLEFGQITDPNLAGLIDTVQLFADDLNRRQNRGRANNRRGRSRGRFNQNFRQRQQPSLFDENHPQGCMCSRCNPNWLHQQYVKIFFYRNEKFFGLLRKIAETSLFG